METIWVAGGESAVLGAKMVSEFGTAIGDRRRRTNEKKNSTSTPDLLLSKKKKKSPRHDGLRGRGRSRHLKVGRYDVF